MKDEEHHTYMDSLCEDFQNRLEDMIQAGIDNHHEVHDKVYSEVVTHTLFRDSKVERFHGREQTVKVGA